MGHFGGLQIAELCYLFNLNSKEKEVENLLSRIEATQNGRLNPHWELASSANKLWKKSYPKMIVHNGVSLVSKMALIIGSLLGLVGWNYQQDNLVFGATVTGVLGLAVWLCENQRYNLFERKEVEALLEQLTNKSHLLLNIKEPFTGQQSNSPLSDVNPEFPR